MGWWSPTPNMSEGRWSPKAECIEKIGEDVGGQSQIEVSWQPWFPISISHLNFTIISPWRGESPCPLHFWDHAEAMVGRIPPSPRWVVETGWDPYSRWLSYCIDIPIAIEVTSELPILHLHTAQPTNYVWLPFLSDWLVKTYQDHSLSMSRLSPGSPQLWSFNVISLMTYV